MLTQVVADGLSEHNGASVLIPVLIAAVVIPFLFARSKRNK